LDRKGRVELRIVASGARRDLGQLDAALVTLQCAELGSDEVASWSARIKFAYADVLAELGRDDEAREWFLRASEVDVDDETEAAERLAEMDGLVWVDLDVDSPEESEVDLTDVDDDDLDMLDSYEDETYEDDLSEDDTDHDTSHSSRGSSLLDELPVTQADDLLEKLEAEAQALERAAAEAIAAVAAARAALESRMTQDVDDSSSD